MRNFAFFKKYPMCVLYVQCLLIWASPISQAPLPHRAGGYVLDRARLVKNDAALGSSEMKLSHPSSLVTSCFHLLGLREHGLRLHSFLLQKLHDSLTSSWDCWEAKCDAAVQIVCKLCCGMQVGGAGSHLAWNAFLKEEYQQWQQGEPDSGDGGGGGCGGSGRNKTGQLSLV